VVMVENAIRCLADRQRQLGRALTEEERREAMTSASLEVVRPVAFGVAIVLVVFLPILSLEGIEGKLFRPMALR
jgi:cobalt-zinc-cadmium resistance protein CzcA